MRICRSLDIAKEAMWGYSALLDGWPYIQDSRLDLPFAQVHMYKGIGVLVRISQSV